MKVERRSFFGRLAAAATGFAAAAVTGARSAQAQSGEFQPARHEQDDWLDRIPGKHRIIFDTITPDAFGQALLFARNYYLINENAYKSPSSEQAIVVVARHLSTACAFNDAMWAKYGPPMSILAEFRDPRTRQAPKVNLYNTDYGELLSRGVTLNSLFDRGLQLAVCEVATFSFAFTIANAIGGNADEINKELLSNLVKNSHLVPAGIVTVNRAQERGYTFIRA